MTTTVHHALDSFGLSAKEVAVYLAALELGGATATQIATRSRINRATTYVALEELTGRRLIATKVIGKKRLFVAEPPHRLIALAEEYKQRWETRLKEIETVLPDLDALYQDSPGKPQVRFYEGKSGLKTVYEDTLQVSNTTIFIYADVEQAMASMGDYLIDRYIPTRMKRNIHAKVVFTDSPLARDRLKRNNRAELRDARLAPAGCAISNEIIIYQDKVAILSFAKPEIGVILQNPQITATQRAIFNLSWEAVGRAAPSESKPIGDFSPAAIPLQ